MKKYIITEEQMNMILNEKEGSIKKGFAIKYNPGEGMDPVYTSEIKDFSSIEEFNSYKDSMGNKREIIGVIDIE